MPRPEHRAQRARFEQAPFVVDICIAQFCPRCILYQVIYRLHSMRWRVRLACTVAKKPSKAAYDSLSAHPNHPFFQKCRRTCGASWAVSGWVTYAKRGVLTWCQRNTDAKAPTKINDKGTRFVYAAILPNPPVYKSRKSVNTISSDACHLGSALALAWLCTHTGARCELARAHRFESASSPVLKRSVDCEHQDLMYRGFTLLSGCFGCFTRCQAKSPPDRSMDHANYCARIPSRQPHACETRSAQLRTVAPDNQLATRHSCLYIACPEPTSTSNYYSVLQTELTWPAHEHQQPSRDSAPWHALGTGRTFTHARWLFQLRLSKSRCLHRTRIRAAMPLRSWLHQGSTVRLFC